MTTTLIHGLIAHREPIKPPFRGLNDAMWRLASQEIARRPVDATPAVRAAVAQIMEDECGNLGGLVCAVMRPADAKVLDDFLRAGGVTVRWTGFRHPILDEWKHSTYPIDGASANGLDFAPPVHWSLLEAMLQWREQEISASHPAWVERLNALVNQHGLLRRSEDAQLALALHLELEKAKMVCELWLERPAVLIPMFELPPVDDLFAQIEKFDPVDPERIGSPE